MPRSRVTLTGLAAVIALALACSRQSAAPTSPSGDAAGTSSAAAPGVTLKANPPSAVSPANDQTISDALTLTASAATMTYGAPAPGPLAYRFQVFNEAGTLVVDSGQQFSTTYRLTAQLEFKKRHTWKVRAEYGSSVSDWSNVASFLSPEGGYIRGNEVFDPLTAGSTVGQVVGPVTWMGNDGVRLDTVSSYIRYPIPVTTTSGEFSMEVKGLRGNASGDKSKVFGMMQGNPDTNDYIANPYRVDVQYRGTTGNPPNSITYRVLYGSADDLDKRYEPTTDQRILSVRSLDPNTTYFWQFTWSNTVRLVVREGSSSGRVLYDVVRNASNGSYNPQPWYAFIGTPTGRSGAESATIPGTIFRNVYIGARPRPF